MDVLVVDDNRIVRNGLAKLLQSEGYQVAMAEHGLAALLKIQEHPYGVIVCDIMMPVMDGMTLYERLDAEYPAEARRVLFMTAWPDEPQVKQSWHAQAGRCCGSPSSSTSSCAQRTRWQGSRVAKLGRWRHRSRSPGKWRTNAARQSAGSALTAGQGRNGVVAVTDAAERRR